MIEKPSTNEIRAQAVLWLLRNRWSKTQLHRAMRGVQISDIASVQLLEKFLGSAHVIPRPYALGLLRFIETYPEPGEFTDFEAQIVESARIKSATRQDTVVERLEANERRRREHIERCLADEHKPKRREFGILFGLEKDVVAALSGGQS